MKNLSSNTKMLFFFTKLILQVGSKSVGKLCDGSSCNSSGRDATLRLGPSKAPKAHSLLLLLLKVVNFLRHNFNLFDLLHPSHSYCPFLTLWLEESNKWGGGVRWEVKGSARRRKSGGTEESNQINIIIPMAHCSLCHTHKIFYFYDDIIQNRA